MKRSSHLDIVDVTDNPEYERFLYRCIFHSKRESYIRHRQRHEYLKSAIPKGFRKKILFWKGDHVGMIEYSPAEASGLPIIGDNVIVMNCIRVQSRAQGRKFGKRLLADMMEDNKQAAGFATLGLEDHWMVYMKRWQMELLGFQTVRSVKVRHKKYKKGRCFTIHLMWLPAGENGKPPT